MGKMTYSYSISRNRVDTIKSLEENVRQLVGMAWWTDSVVDLTQVGNV